MLNNKNAELENGSQSKKTFGLHNWLLISILAINAMSIAGYATFSLNPAMLSKYDYATVIFNYSYYFFARTQIIVSFLAIASLLYEKNQFKWLKEIIFVFCISLLMEWLGTSFGIPFGKYEYTDLLGWKLLNKVPLLIPISWFFMSIPAYCMANKFQNMMNIENKIIKGFFNIVFASIFLTSWDFTLDPAMSNLTPFWIWESKGSYFGTPMVNFGGWLLTSAFIMLGFELLNTKRLFDEKDIIWNIKFYFANLSLPIGLVICSGLWMPIVFTVVTFAIIYLFSYSISLLRSKKHQKENLI